MTSDNYFILRPGTVIVINLYIFTLSTRSYFNPFYKQCIDINIKHLKKLGKWVTFSLCPLKPNMLGSSLCVGERMVYVCIPVNYVNVQICIHVNYMRYKIVYI